MKKIHIIHNRIWKRGLAGMLALSLFLSCVPGFDAEALQIYDPGNKPIEIGGSTTEATTRSFEAVTETLTEVTTEATTMAPTETATETATESGTDGDSTGDGDAATEAAMDQSSLLPNYSVTPNTDVPAYEAYKGMSEWNNGTITNAMANTYSLTIATGESAGDAVLYFVVRYKDTSGVTKSQFVFPNTDGGARSDSILRYRAGDDLDKAYGSSNIDNYKYAENSAKESPLDSWTVQDYIFTTESTIASIEKVEVYLSTGTTGTSSSQDSENNTLSSDGDNDSKETVNDSNTQFVTNNKQTAGNDTGDNVIRKIEVSDTNGIIKTDEDTEGAVKVIPSDTTLRFSSNSGSTKNTNNPDVKYRYDDKQQDFIEDKGGRFKYDSELETYYENSAENLYYYPERFEFITKEEYIKWKNEGVEPRFIYYGERLAIDSVTHTFYLSSNGMYHYDEQLKTIADETSNYKYYDFNVFSFRRINDLTSQTRYSDYNPQFKENTNYYYDVYNRIFKEDTNGKFVYDPELETVYHTEKNIYFDINSRKFFEKEKLPKYYRYDDFNQDFIPDKNGKFLYDPELENYYIETGDKASTKLYFYPERYDFVTEEQYTEWKKNGVEIFQPDTEKFEARIPAYSFDEITKTFYVDKSNGSYHFTTGKKTFYISYPDYYDFEKKALVNVNTLKKQTRYGEYDPEFKENTNYYYDVYTRTFKEDPNGKFVYDPEIGTVYHTEKNVYYDISSRKFFEMNNTQEYYRYDDFNQDFIPSNVGRFQYDSQLETYYIKTGDSKDTELYFYPEKYEFVTKEQYIEWWDNGVTPDMQPREDDFVSGAAYKTILYSYNKATHTFYELTNGLYRYSTDKETFYDSTQTNGKFFDFNNQKFVSMSELTEQIRYKKPKPEYEEGVNYYYDVYTRRFKEDANGKFVYDPEVGTVYHTEKDVYYDISSEKFVKKDKLTECYRYDDFDQNFIKDDFGDFLYDSKLKTYYIETGDSYVPSLYFYPEKYEFVTKEQYTEWKNNGVTPDTTPKELEYVNGKFGNKISYYYNEITHTFHKIDIELVGYYSYSEKKRTFNKGNNYFDFSKKQFVSEADLTEQVRYKKKPKPEYEEGVNYYFDVYTRTFKENDNGKFVYDPSVGTVYHTVKNVYYDINVDKFVPKNQVTDQDAYTGEDEEKDESFYTGNAVPASQLSHKKSVTTNNKGIIGTNTKTSFKGTWTIQGLSIYKVKRYKSYEEYGLVTGQKFLDFEGFMIADVKKRGGGTLTFSTSGVDTVITIGGAEDSNYCDIVNYGSREVERSFASDSSLYSIRMDMADQLNAGIEAFTNSDGTKISGDNGIVEDIAIEMQYKDTHGWTRKVTVPFILSSYMAASKACGDDTILGFAGRGDTVAMQGLFPEFDRLATSPKIYVGNTARTKVSEKGINVSKATTKMNTAITATASDDISLAGVSMYKGGCMPYVTGGTDSDGQALTGATLQYVFESAEPFQYYTTTDTKGRMVKANGNDTIKLVAYKSGSPLVASVFGRDRYLVTLKTSDKKRSGTKDDISLMFYYEKQDGTSASTISYRVKQGANDFLGAWPTKTGANYLETAGLANGGDISFLIEAPDLKTFTGVDISLLGDDEWVMDNLIIALVDDVQLRRAYIKDDNSTNYWVERQMTIAPIFSLKGLDAYVQDDDGNALDEDGRQVEKKKEQKYDDDGNPVYDDDGNPVYVEVDDDDSSNQTRTMSDQMFTGGQTINFSFNTRTVNDVRDADYASVRYRMTYDQTGVNWGFAKKKITYDISVKVAEDPDYDMGNGDSGSTNYFYFQLIFKNGNSAYVLANQQISSDGFRSGATEVFTISVNRDYGDVTGVRIIPEDISSDSDPFDKLNIDTITVTQQTNGGAAMMYIIGQVGWIDIDYRDENESASLRGQKARTAAEISKLCKVTDKKRVYNLLCEFTNLPWNNDYYQLEGSVMATVYYMSAATNKVEKQEFDVVSRLAAYMNKTAKSYDAPSDPDAVKVASSQMKTISDPEWMFRPNTTDRFIMPPLADVSSIQSIVFTAQSRNGYPATWNIGKVCISEIEENGGLQLNGNEEYVRTMKTKSLCASDGETVTVNVNIGTPSASKEIKFNENSITWTAEGWATPVSRMPDSSDDKINVYVYPAQSTRNIADSKVNMFFQYGIPFSQYMQKTDVLQPANSGTSDAVFYSLGLSVKDFISASTLGIQCSNSRLLFDHAIVQHVRDDVVMNTFTYMFTLQPSAVITLRTDPSMSNPYVDRTEETIALSFGANTEEQVLVNEDSDVAVAFYYKSTIDGGRMEYRSPYVYLTDQGYSSISEGLFAELTYDVPYVSEITGYSIAGYGDLKGNVDAAAGVVYHVDKTQLNEQTGVYETVERSKRSYASFDTSYALTENLTKYKTTNDKCYGDDSVAPVAVTFTTAEASNVLDSGTESKVQMAFNYTDYKGVKMTRTFVDATPYIQGDVKKFEANKDATVKFFIHELDKDLSLTSVDIIPYNGKKVTTKDINVVSDDAVKSQTDTTDSNSTNDANNTNSTNSANTTTDATNGTGTGDIQTTDNTNTAVSNMEETDEVNLLTKTLESMNASWTISGVVCDIAWGEKIKSRPITQQFLGLEKGGTLRFNDITMTIDVMRSNGSTTQVKDGIGLVTVKPGESLSAVIKIAGSTGGYSAHAYKMFGEAGDEVPSTLSNITTIGFTFTAPTNISGGAEEYKIEVAPVDAPDMIYTIRVWVQSDQVTTEATTEATTEKATEKATEAATAEATTEAATTEAPTEAATETATEAATEATP